MTTDCRERVLRELRLLRVSERFTTIPDPRSGHGRRASLLTCLITALLCTCDVTGAMRPWCRDQHDLLHRLFPSQRWLCPSDSLSRTRLARVPADQAEWALAYEIGSTACAAPNDPMARDGTTVCAARTDEHAAPPVLSLRTHQRQATLLHVAVSEQTHEIPIAQALFPCLPLVGRVCTADALQEN